MESLFAPRAASRGMTLIEIMVVVFILGLIATVVAINVGRAQVHAEVGTAGTELSNLRGMLDMFRLSKGRYPTSAEGLTVLFTEHIATGKPKKDPWGHDYVYTFPSPSDPGGYELRSLGPDGQPGTEDDLELP